MKDETNPRKRWSEEETVLALYLYFQLPFGKLHSGNPEIQKLAAALGRSSGSVAMKLVNFASLDPKITESGRRGLAGTSRLDRATYAEFGQDWSALVDRAVGLWAARVEQSESAPLPNQVKDKVSEFRFEPYQGASTTQVMVNQRVGQDFFRRAVLANYAETAASPASPIRGCSPRATSNRGARTQRTDTTQLTACCCRRRSTAPLIGA
jgi:putative restriction endonuclease